MRVSTPSPLEEQQVHYFTNQNALDLAFDQATLSFTDNTYEEVVAQGPWPITTAPIGIAQYTSRQQERENNGANLVARLYKGVLSGNPHEDRSFLC